jgi:hypothetical protein
MTVCRFQGIKKEKEKKKGRPRHDCRSSSTFARREDRGRSDRSLDEDSACSFLLFSTENITVKASSRKKLNIKKAAEDHGFQNKILGSKILNQDLLTGFDCRTHR